MSNPDVIAKLKEMAAQIADSEWGSIAVVPEYVRHHMRGRANWPWPEAWPTITWKQLSDALALLTAARPEKPRFVDCPGDSPDDEQSECIGCDGTGRGDCQAVVTAARPETEWMRNALLERVYIEHDNATHWPKGSERDGHKGDMATCPHEDCQRLTAAPLSSAQEQADDDEVSR